MITAYGGRVYDEELAEVYDTLYTAGYTAGREKSYPAEAAALTRLIRHRNPGAASLLDVACGTGEHLRHLRAHFDDVEGLDLSAAMRRRAAAKVPGVPIHAGDLRSFRLPRRYDAVTCLFSSIGYVGDRAELDAAVATMAAHLNPGGVLVVEPWFSPEQWRDDSIHHTVAESGDRTVVRVTHAGTAGRTSVMTMHYLVAAVGGGVRHFADEHRMALFTDGEYRSAFATAGLEVAEVPGWSEGRRRLVGTAPR